MKKRRFFLGLLTIALLSSFGAAGIKVFESSSLQSTSSFVESKAWTPESDELNSTKSLCGSFPGDDYWNNDRDSLTMTKLATGVFIYENITFSKNLDWRIINRGSWTAQYGWSHLQTRSNMHATGADNKIWVDNTLDNVSVLLKYNADINATYNQNNWVIYIYSSGASNFVNAFTNKNIVGSVFTDGWNNANDKLLLTRSTSRLGYYYKQGINITTSYPSGQSSARWRIVDSHRWDPDYGYNIFRSTSLSWSSMGDEDKNDENCIRVRSNVNADVVLFYEDEVGRAAGFDISSYSFSKWRLYVNPTGTTCTVRYLANGGSGTMANETITINNYCEKVPWPSYIKGNQCGTSWKCGETTITPDTFFADIIQYADANGVVTLTAQYDGTSRAGLYLQGEQLNSWSESLNDMVFLGSEYSGYAEHVYLSSSTSGSAPGYKTNYWWPVVPAANNWTEFTSKTINSSIDGTKPADVVVYTGNSYGNFIPTVSGYYTISISIEKVSERKLGYYTFTYDKCKISFNMNGHGSSISDVYVPYDQVVSEPSTPTASGYYFAGWYRDAECTKPWNFDWKVNDDVTDSNHELKLYARWRDKTTITWLNDDGSVLRRDYNVPYGSTPSYGSTPTKASTGEKYYNFTGWTPTVSSVTGDVEYTAQYSDSTTQMRLYINKNWGGTPYVGSGFNKDYQNATVQVINADPTHHIPASGTSVVQNHSDVKDFSVHSAGQTDIYCTFFEGNDRWAPEKGWDGHTETWNDMKNGIKQDDDLKFENGYIYYLQSISGTGYKYQTGGGDYGNEDPYDNNRGRTVKFYTYSCTVQGVFIHYDLDGGSFSDSASVDTEHKYDDNLTLPAAPTKSGYTFMGWQASTNGLLNRASTTFDNVTKPMSFRAIWHSNTIQGVDANKVRVIVSYDTAGANYNAAYGSYFCKDFGTYTKLWIHEKSGSTSGSVGLEEYITAEGTFYNTHENVNDSYISNCPRRFDYFDIPIGYFEDGFYLTVQRFLSDGTASNKSGQIQLSLDSTWSQKVLYVQSTWENTPVLSATTNNKGDAMLAAISLAGLHSCSSSNVLNGCTGYSNWLSSFVTNKGVNVSDLASYDIQDFSYGDTTYSSVTDKSVNAFNKYMMVQSNASGGGRGAVGLGIFNNLISRSDDDQARVIITIVCSSVAILSMTVLSTLVYAKKKKSKSNS